MVDANNNTDNGNDIRNCNYIVHQNMVFNIAGLMYNLIFNHCLRFCNNSNSIHSVHVGNFIKQSFNNIDSNNGNNIYTRACKKYFHAKKVYIHTPTIIKNQRYGLIARSSIEF